MVDLDPSLRDFGTDYFKEMLNRPKPPKEVKYGRNHLQVGKIIDKYTGKVTDKVFYLDIEETSRLIFLGATRSGKTFFIRSMADRIKELNDAVVLLTDIKNEFFSSNQAVQEKFRSGLLPGEKPKPMRVITLRPTFFKQINDRKEKSNYWYSIDSKKLSRADFMSLMNISELSPTQKTSMELIFQDFQKKIGAEPNTQMDYPTMETIIEMNEDMDGRQKQILKFKFKPLENSHFIEEEHAKSIITLLKKGFVPAINLENFDSFGKGSFQYPEVLLNIAFREIVVARRAKKIPRTWIFLDEASRFIGNSKRNSFKDSVLESTDLDTRYGIFLAYIFQSISDIPERIIKQSRYIFIPSTADINTIKETLTSTGMVKNVQVSVNEAIKLKNQMKKVKYSWIVLDRMNASMDLITPLPPLSFHLETTK